MSVALFPKFSNIPNLPKFSIDCAPSPPPSCPTGGSPAIPPPPSRTHALPMHARAENFVFRISAHSLSEHRFSQFSHYFIDKNGEIADFLVHFFTAIITPHPFRNAL